MFFINTNRVKNDYKNSLYLHLYLQMIFFKKVVYLSDINKSVRDEEGFK